MSRREYKNRLEESMLSENEMRLLGGMSIEARHDDFGFAFQCFSGESMCCYCSGHCDQYQTMVNAIGRSDGDGLCNPHLTRRAMEALFVNES